MARATAQALLDLSIDSAGPGRPEAGPRADAILK